MAEFAALSVAASILQVIDISVRVAERLNSYRKKDGALPNVLETISNRLPALIDALGDTKSALEAMTDKARKAITPCINGCLVQIKRLDAMMDKAVPKLSDSSRTRGFKAIVSVKYESDIKETDEAIRTYIAILAQHRILSSAIPDSANQQPAPTPSSTCPFEREPGFVERDVMNEVMSRCQPGTRLALKGIGGVGKSRIAIEHSYRIRDASPQTWVFWVSLDNVSATTRDFRKIGKAVHVPGWDEKGTDIFTLVRDWLKDDSHGPWIMVLDNADDVNVLTAPAPNAVPVGDEDDVSTQPQIREFITTSQNGSILVTSRNTEAAQMITGNCAYHIDVEEMNETEALALLKSKLSAKVLYTEAEATELVKAIDCMPLAVSQIATNISINYPRLTIQKAIEKLKNPSQDTVQLLESSVHETSRDVHRSNSIVKTWHLSFQYVRESNPSAARLLSLMCLFDRQGIPEALLTGQYGTEATTVVTPLQPHLTWWKRVRRRRLRLRRLEKPSQKNKLSQDEHTSFDDDWRVLTNFALIKTNVDGRHFNMHRLVQHTTKRWLDINGELKLWMKKYVSIMKKCFPKPEHNNWAMCQYLFPHAQKVALYHPEDESALEWATLMKEISDFAGSNGSWLVAEELGRVALATFEAITGNSEDALGCMHQMGMVLSAQNKYQEAEIMYRKAFEGREIVLPPDHPDTLDSANMLGGVLNLQKRYDEGQVMQMRALEGRERVFGPEHSETQFFLTRLVFAWVTEGRYEQAGRLQQRLHRTYEQKFGMDSKNTQESLRGLAILLGMQGKLSEAEHIHRHIVDNKTKMPGPYSVETLGSINSLGEMLFKQGKLEEAAMRYQQAIEGCSDSEKACEVVLHSMDNLAQIFLEQGKLEEAEDVARQMIAKREILLGPNNIDTLVGVHTLASILMKQKRYEEAVLSYERAYVGTMEACGADHPDTKEFLDDLQQSKHSMFVWQRRDCGSPEGTKSDSNSIAKPSHPVDVLI